MHSHEQPCCCSLVATSLSPHPSRFIPVAAAQSLQLSRYSPVATSQSLQPSRCSPVAPQPKPAQPLLASSQAPKVTAVKAPKHPSHSLCCKPLTHTYPQTSAQALHCSHARTCSSHERKRILRPLPKPCTAHVLGPAQATQGLTFLAYACPAASLSSLSHQASPSNQPCCSHPLSNHAYNPPPTSIPANLTSQDA